jgi:uncharacterized protein with PQ loop repeat
MDASLPFIAGIISTTIFAFSTLPMLRKAFQTKDLGSYSLGQITLANAGNAIHSVYVFHMPPGPIWLLHTFYLVSTGMMLFWYLRYEGLPHQSGNNRPSGSSDQTNQDMSAIPHQQEKSTPVIYHFRGMAAR